MQHALMLTYHKATNVIQSAKTRLMEGQKVPAFIRHCTFCAASHQSWDFLSLINIYSELFFVAPCAVLIINTITNM